MKKLTSTLLITLVSFCSGEDTDLHLVEFRNYEKDLVGRMIDYSVYLPDNYNEDRQWPLIIFLHGGGMRGAEPELVQKKGVAIKLDEGERFPFVLLIPQCPPDFGWEELEVMDAVIYAIHETTETYQINRRKIYLTGNSMGGIGTWHIANYDPDLFAAIAPLSGYATFDEAANLADVPIWAFHGALDDIIPLEVAEKTVTLVREHNPNLKFTVLPEYGHRPWKDIYKNDEIYSWLLKHTKPNKSVDTTPASAPR